MPKELRRPMFRTSSAAAAAAALPCRLPYPQTTIVDGLSHLEWIQVESLSSKQVATDGAESDSSTSSALAPNESTATVACHQQDINPHSSSCINRNRNATNSSSSSSSSCTSNETNLIVNYLPSSMTQDDIRSLFSSLGELDSCKLIRDKTSGQSLGYGFVKYKRSGDAKKAIASLNGLRLQTKIIKVSFARPSSETIKGANLYVSGLPKSMTSHDLRKLFSPFGDIITSRVLCDVQTGLSKGVGFIRFNLKSEAEAAIKDLNGSNPNGSKEPITVKFANQPTVNKPTPLVISTGQLTNATLCTQTGQVIASFPPTIHHALRYSNPADVIGSLAVNGPSPLSAGPVVASSWTLLVHNLPPSVDDGVLWGLFGPFGPVRSARVLRDPATMKSTGYGLVTMTSYDDAMLAISAISGQQLDNHVVQVTFKDAVHTPTLVARSQAVCQLASSGTPSSGFGLYAGAGFISPNCNLLGNAGNTAPIAGLQLVGINAYPRAVAMPTGPDCGLTALPIM